MKVLFKKPDHISKSFFWFIWFTIFSFIVGLVVKIVVMEFEARGLNHIIDAKKKFPDQDFSSSYISDLSMLIMQVLIIILTLVIYPKSLIEQYRITKNKNHIFSRKAYKSFKKEYIIFLAVFIFLDVASLGMLIQSSIKYNFEWDFDIIFAVVSIFIPTPLVIGSLFWLKKLKQNGEVQL